MHGLQLAPRSVNIMALELIEEFKDTVRAGCAAEAFL
jgi:hypothetical protein